jgi:hypothetical protein
MPHPAHPGLAAVSLQKVADALVRSGLDTWEREREPLVISDRFHLYSTQT